LVKEVYAGDGIDVFLLAWKPAPGSGDEEGDRKDSKIHNK
jgi:hypothetical protein